MSEPENTWTLRSHIPAENGYVVTEQRLDPETGQRVYRARAVFSAAAPTIADWLAERLLATGRHP